MLVPVDPARNPPANHPLLPGPGVSLSVAVRVPHLPVMASTATARNARRITAAEAAGLVRSGDWLDHGVTL